MQKLTELKEWQALQAHYAAIATLRMRDLFEADPERFARFSMACDGIFLDYSKNRITPETIRLLCDLANARQLKDKITHLFKGDSVNNTENRPALHTALRAPSTEPLLVNGHNIMPLIAATLDQMETFTDQVRSKTWLGATGKPISDIVNIGIGGSHLGPMMATHALADFAAPDLRCHFISNIDSAHLNEVLNKIDPEASLFIISSKSFTTLETMTNAQTIRQWLQQKLGCNDLTAHFVAITAMPENARRFGIPNENIFCLWDFVGGRYSIWSAIGLPLALSIGMPRFREFLAGAHAMDMHFLHTEFSENMPVIMALLGIWYINFFGAAHHAIIPYSHHLNYFRTHLQQLDMESNGKNIAQHGGKLDYLTGPVILGGQGCNAQHAFHQLLHQGQHFIPVDFLLVGKSADDFSNHHDILIGSGLSQAQALMNGKTYEQALAECLQMNYPQDECELMARHKVIPGNRPSNTVFISQITPYNLGSLLAMYEHKTYVQGAIWHINPFDQWGVELGKNLLPSILNDIATHLPITAGYDSSTHGLIEHYKNLKVPS